MTDHEPDEEPIEEPMPAKTSKVHIIVGAKNWKRVNHLTTAWKCTPEKAVERALEEAVLRVLD